ncbi:hypothetical protein NKH18_07015 [Streptomyces sp. M10(2022)]
MHRSDLQAAVQPSLAQDVADRRPPAPAATARPDHDRGFTRDSPSAPPLHCQSSPRRPPGQDAGFRRRHSGGPAG